MEFNINNRVKVKLNEKGLEILKKQSEELRARLPSFPEFKPPRTDDDGFSRWQMWELMWRFGEHISLGVSVPFETTIHFDEPNEITTLRQKLEQAQTENGRVRKANLDVMMHFDDMKAAREQAEARCAELEDALTAIRNTATNAPFSYNMKWIFEYCENALGDRCASAWLLGKQAEAVEAIKPTAEMKAEMLGSFKFTEDMTCSACYFDEPDNDCEVCGGDVTYAQDFQIPWTSQKQIIGAAVNHAAQRLRQQATEL